MKMWLIADSGGTSTTWVYGAEKIIGSFKTASLHPRNIDSFPNEDAAKLSNLANDFPFDRVQFYGAGMSNPQHVDRISAFLHQFGFTGFEIHTDALAAGLACCGNEHGFVAILGTGSILIEMKDGEIVRRLGGLGPESGDEGSGYYFSKLLLDHLKADQNWTEEWIALFGSREKFQRKYNESSTPSELAKLAELTAELDLSEIHRLNFGKFIETHLKFIATDHKILNVVGSYGCFQKEVLGRELERSGWRLNKCLIDPLQELVHRMFKNN